MTLRMTTGRVLVKLCDCPCHAPAHLDVVAGAAREREYLDEETDACEWSAEDDVGCGSSDAGAVRASRQRAIDV